MIITTSPELLIVRTQICSEETKKVIHRILEKEKKQSREPPNKTKSLGYMHPPPKSTRLQNGMCCSQEKLLTLGMRHETRTISTQASLISFIRFPFCKTVP